MKKRVIFVVVALLLLITIPVAAKEKEPVGPSLDWDVTTFLAGEPFHIQHGWRLGPTPMKTFNPGGYSFELELDGEIIKPSYKMVGYNPSEENYEKLYIYNFPDGMTGTHTFIGHYYGTCSDWYDDCKNPRRSVELVGDIGGVTYPRVQTIVFTSP